MLRLAPKRAVLIALPLALALSGCKGNSIDGKWKLTGETNPALGGMTMTFHDGTVKIDTSASQPQIGTIKITGTGTYKLVGDNLTTTIADVKIDDTNATPFAKAALSNPQAQTQMRSQLNQMQTAKIKFDSSDQILLTTNGKTATLTRVK